jgi:hypothetical protein
MKAGIAANVSMVSAQFRRVRETWPQEVWARTGRVQLSSAILASLVAGKWTSMGESEACTAQDSGENPKYRLSDSQQQVSSLLLLNHSIFYAIFLL